MESDKQTLNIEGMTCTNCALGVKKQLEKSGYRDVNVNFSTGKATFERNESVDQNAAIKRIGKLGFRVVDDPNAPSTGWTPLQKRLLVSALFTLPLMAHMVLSHDHILNNPWVQMILALPVYLIGVFSFGRSAWSSLKSGVPNMDVLIFIGSSAAFIYSTVGTLLHYGTPEVHNYLFFETAATIVTLVTLGNLIEERSVKQTTSAIGELQSLQKASAWVKRGEGFEKVSAEEITAGDHLRVNEGDAIPVDGVVLSGSGKADESMISGESERVSKKTGDTVYAGTTWVDGNMEFRATVGVNGTYLSEIIRVVENAQSDQPEIQRLGDRISAIFVPTVVGIALLTFAINLWVADVGLQSALLRSIAVLVISCPCAMGLATPTAVMVGLGRAAKKGILVKGGSTLEEFTKVKRIVFDKTGTLTTGNFAIVDQNYSEIERETALGIIHALESKSSHPIALSLLAIAKDTPSIELLEIKEEKGSGVRGKDDEGNTYFIGKSEGSNWDISLFINDKSVAHFRIEDEVRAGSKEAVQWFKSRGIEPVMLSGDKREKCEKLASELGIKEVYAEQKPLEKIGLVRKWSKKSKVAMVGDGINDAPALTQAQVGISLGNASKIAIDSAEIILTGQEQMQILIDAFGLSVQTYKTIKQNLFWAFFYNVLAIPIAAVGLLSPMIAALSMAFSDVIVVGNSLRLKRKKIH
jgi:Cu+-exporting ATPase